MVALSIINAHTTVSTTKNATIACLEHLIETSVRTALDFAQIAVHIHGIHVGFNHAARDV